MKEKKFDKQKLLTTVVTAILIFFFIGGFWLGLDRVRSMEGTFLPNDIKEGISPAPETVQEAEEYLRYVTDKAVNSNPALSYDCYFSVDTDSIETDGSDSFRKALVFAAGNFEDHISGAEESEEKISSVNFGEDISVLLNDNRFGTMSAGEFTCSYIYYSCPSCGVTSDDPLDSCEACGSIREYYKKYRGEYEIVLDELYTAPGDTSPYDKRSEEEIDALIKGLFDGVLTIDSRNIEYTGFRIAYNVNRLTDEITSLKYIRDMAVSVDVTFIGEYEKLGKKKISFNITETDSYGFSWPALSLNKETLVIEPKNSDNLLAELTCEDPLAMTISWTSSDESIATVDAEGYIDATKKTGEVTITASFEYLGKVYEDSCTVFVRVPVESMKMSKKTVKLGEGESFTLETKISPASATVQTVKWYSEDESIACVDENGVVTAKGKGSVIVYALSDDGYYRSTCEVTVE